MGPWDLRGPEDERLGSVLSQPKRLCLLAYLAVVGRPVSRSSLVALFWPESDEDRARNALSQSVFHLRRSLSKAAVESVEGDRLYVPTELVQCDVRRFLDGSWEPAEATDGFHVDAARRVDQGAEFFEGWNADDTQELQEWVDGVRRRVRERADEVMATTVAEDRGAPLDAGPATEAGRSEGSARDDHGGEDPQPTSGHRWARWWDDWEVRQWLVASVGVAAVVLTILLVARGTPTESSVTSPNGTSVRTGADAPGVPVTDSRPVVAVLMPRVSATGEAPPRLADAVQDEILAALDRVDGIRSIPFSSIDPAALERFLDDQFQVPDSSVTTDVSPDWVIVVNLRVAGNRVRANLQFRGSESHRDWYPEGRDYEAADPAEALLDLPQQIARSVVGRFEGWIAQEQPTPPPTEGR